MRRTKKLKFHIFLRTYRALGCTRTREQYNSDLLLLVMIPKNFTQTSLGNLFASLQTGVDTFQNMKLRRKNLYFYVQRPTSPNGIRF